MGYLYFISDCHFNHKNIIEYCNRPFKDIDIMNKTIIHNWNEMVKEDDTIIHVGDFCFKNTPGGKEGEGGIEPTTYWKRQLNGEKIFIKGNHDKNNGLKTAIIGMELYYANTKMWLIHNPLYYNKNYDINIVGHVHQNWKMINKYDHLTRKNTILVNVGVDVWNFRPVRADKLIGLITKYKRDKNIENERNIE